MQNPRAGAGARDRKAGGHDHGQYTAPPYRLQDTLESAIRHHWTAAELGALLALRLDRSRRLLLAAGALHALALDDREAVADAILCDLRGGPPVPRFASVKDEAQLWADWASPAERKHYLLACFNRLSRDDRMRFLRAVV